MFWIAAALLQASAGHVAGINPGGWFASDRIGFCSLNNRQGRATFDLQYFVQAPTLAVGSKKLGWVKDGTDYAGTISITNTAGKITVLQLRARGLLPRYAGGVPMISYRLNEGDVARLFENTSSIELSVGDQRIATFDMREVGGPWETVRRCGVATDRYSRIPIVRSGSN